jgi:DNA-binding MurR/RpiR family transcriptional regulator
MILLMVDNWTIMSNSNHTRISANSRTSGQHGHQATPVLQLLEDAAQDMGLTGERLLRAIRVGYPGSMLAGTAELTASAGVAPGTPDALAAAAGLRDFAEARRLVRAEIDRGLRTPDARYSARLAGKPHNQPVPLLDRIAEQDCANVTSTLRRLAASGSLERAAEALLRSRRVFLVADRKSYAYAHLLGTDLQSFMRKVVVIDGLVNRPAEVLSDVTADDAALCFSFRRYAATTLRTARFLRAAGAAVIGITDDAGSAMAEISDISLVVETTSESFVDSPTAVASAVHALVTVAATRSRGTRSRLADRDQIARTLGVYEESGS